jgi:hypothetical protein
MEVGKGQTNLALHGCRVQQLGMDIPLAITT